jgi:hypothetical protein
MSGVFDYFERISQTPLNLIIDVSFIGGRNAVSLIDERKFRAITELIKIITSLHLPLSNRPDIDVIDYFERVSQTPSNNIISASSIGESKSRAITELIKLLKTR